MYNTNQKMPKCNICSTNQAKYKIFYLDPFVLLCNSDSNLNQVCYLERDLTPMKNLFYKKMCSKCYGMKKNIERIMNDDINLGKIEN